MAQGQLIGMDRHTSHCSGCSKDSSSRRITPAMCPVFTFVPSHPTIGWSEIGQKNFFLQFQLARYVKRCQCISRTLCKNFKIFEIFFDLPFQLFILQHYAVLEVMGSLASS